MPPGGGPPPMTPMSGGPPGNVPDVSNERRPGLTYNTHHQPMITEAALADAISEWPEELQVRAAAIYSEIQNPEIASDTVIASSEEPVNPDETDDPETWVLGSRQKLEQEGETHIIVEGRRKRPEMPIEPNRKYSIIDPLATPLEEITEPNGSQSTEQSIDTR